ncbi:Fc.00g060480.m01.CDS01 [Cosmosporella sp. VM-42]
METGTLVLLIHHGQQRLMSIRLSELLKSSVGASDIVSIDQQLLRLCIKVPRQNQAVVAQFEEKRDFSVAVYMLQKARFHINESISSVLSASASTFQASSSLNYELDSILGPRLSSITPLPGLSSVGSVSSGGNQATASFTSLLNSPLSSADMAFTPVQAQPLPPSPSSQIYQRMCSLPTYFDSSSPFFDPAPMGMQLDPYNAFSGNSINPYRPRVSSPLKMSSRPGEPTRHVSLEPIAAHNSVHMLAPPAATSPIATKEGITNVEERSFRDLMPRPRTLPFDYKLKSQKQPNMASPVAALNPDGHKKTRAVAEGEPRNELDKSVTIASSKKTLNAESQTGLGSEVSCTTCPSSSPPMPRSSPRERRDVSELLVFVTDPDALWDVNRSTARFLDQYSADVAGGSDEMVSAKFYMDQVQAARWDFWYAKLIEMEGAKLGTPV